MRRYANAGAAVAFVEGGGGEGGSGLFELRIGCEKAAEGEPSSRITAGDEVIDAVGGGQDGDGELGRDEPKGGGGGIERSGESERRAKVNLPGSGIKVEVGRFFRIRGGEGPDGHAFCAASEVDHRCKAEGAMGGDDLADGLAGGGVTGVVGKWGKLDFDNMTGGPECGGDSVTLATGLRRVQEGAASGF